MAENQEKLAFTPLLAGIVVGALVVGGLIGAGIVLLAGGSSKIRSASGQGVVNLFPEKSTAVGNEWVVKIDDYAVSKKDFEEAAKEAFKAYRQQYDQLPAEQKAQIPMPDDSNFKKLYLEEIIKQNIVTLKAFTDNDFKAKVTPAMLSMMMRQALVQLYVQSKMPDQTAFIPSKVEIDQYYKQNKEQFDKTGASATQIKDYITQQLARQKLQVWQNEFLQQAKEGFKITRNPEIVGTAPSIGVNPAGAGNGLIPAGTN
jgi:hypothetical protein